MFYLNVAGNRVKKQGERMNYIGERGIVFLISREAQSVSSSEFLKMYRLGVVLVELKC